MRVREVVLAADRAAILESLKRHLKKGETTVISNAGYPWFLKREGEGRVAIDRNKVATDVKHAKFDGVFVLRKSAASASEKSPVETPFK